MENKFPGKDITLDDLKTKFPLVAKKNDKHVSVVDVAGVEFGGNNKEAIESVREKREGAIETKEQEYFILSYRNIN